MGQAAGAGAETPGSMEPEALGAADGFNDSDHAMLVEGFEEHESQANVGQAASAGDEREHESQADRTGQAASAGSGEDPFLAAIRVAGEQAVALVEQRRLQKPPEPQHGVQCSYMQETV